MCKNKTIIEPAQILIEDVRPISYNDFRMLLDSLPTTLSTAFVDRIKLLLTSLLNQ